MKKQILILTFFIAAIFAGTLNSYAQDADWVNAADVGSLNCVAPTPLGACADNDELHPIPGQTYNYEIDVNPDVTTGNITWFVYNATDNPSDIITGGSISAAVTAAEADGGGSLYLLDAEDGVYNTTTTATDIDISWQSFNGASKEILLVAYVEGEDGCSDNIEVWRIEPTFAFTLDIAGLMDDGTTNYGTGFTNANECVSPVQSATYDGTNLTMDYGENYIYFVVNAANFVHGWQPTFTIVDNSTETTVAMTDIMWAYPDQAILNASGAASGTWNSASTPVLAQNTSDAVGDGGECIYVRVHLDHGAAENDAEDDHTFTLGVDGVMYDATLGDYSNATDLTDLDPGATSPCTNTVTDQAVYDLTERPQITEVNPTHTDGPFEPKN